jgi:hypothetical protein
VHYSNILAVIYLSLEIKGRFGNRKSRRDPRVFPGPLPHPISGPGPLNPIVWEPNNRGTSDPILEFSLGEPSRPLDSCRRDPMSHLRRAPEGRRTATSSPSAPPRRRSFTIQAAAPSPSTPPLLHHPRRSKSRNHHRRPRSAAAAVSPDPVPPLQIYNTTILAGSSAFWIHHGSLPSWICEFSPFLISYSWLGFVD